MKCQSLFSGKNEIIILNLSSAEFANREVKVSTYFVYFQTTEDSLTLIYVGL